MPTRQTYTVLVPFPTHAGHWSVVGEELDLLDVEATALRTAGRLEPLLTAAIQSQLAVRKPLHLPSLPVANVLLLEPYADFWEFLSAQKSLRFPHPTKHLGQNFPSTRHGAENSETLHTHNHTVAQQTA